MQTKRILIIEDDADAADVLDAYLKREGYDVQIAGDGLSGLEHALRWKPDLILLDVMLPGMRGTDVLASLRRESSTPVIMVTAMGDMPDKIGALRFGADDYVVKPYNPGKWWPGCRQCCAVLQQRKTAPRRVALAGTRRGCRGADGGGSLNVGRIALS